MLAVLGLLALVVAGCDPFRKKKCEWYLVPEPKHIDQVGMGFVSLCATNYILDRRRCYLQAKIELAEKMYGKPFRYSELELSEKEFPRTVVNVVECTPEK